MNQHRLSLSKTVAAPRVLDQLTADLEAWTAADYLGFGRDPIRCSRCVVVGFASGSCDKNSTLNIFPIYGVHLRLGLLVLDNEWITFKEKTR